VLTSATYALPNVLSTVFILLASAIWLRLLIMVAPNRAAAHRAER
jgi:hypothetical protein